MKEKELYSIKDVCDRYRITRKTLFYYDKVGLLEPTERVGKQSFKYYDDQALQRLEKIHQYREAGLSIAEVKEIIDTGDKKKILTVLKEVKRRLNNEILDKQKELKKLDELIVLNS